MSRPARFSAAGDGVQAFRHSVARGESGWFARLAAGALFATLSPLSAQQNDEAFDPRDLSGNWDRETAIVTYSNVPGSFRDPVNRQMPDQGPTAEPPFTEEGRRQYLDNMPGYGANRREFERNDPFGRCEPAGIPRNLTVEIIEPHDTFEIVQTDDRILQFFEYRHDWREIWMDGRELPAFEDTWPTWNGFSVGRFDGDTLVVETIGFDARTWLDKYGHPHSEEMRLEERYRRLDADTLELTMTIRDPVMYSEPWNSDTKIYSLNRDRHHQWDEQIYCIPAEEFSLQELFGTGNTID